MCKITSTYSRVQWLYLLLLTHWGRVTHICINKLTIIGSYKGLSPGRRQAIVWTNAGILLIGPLGTNFTEILLEVHTFSLKKMHSKMSSGKWWPFCLSLNVLRTYVCLEACMFLFVHHATACLIPVYSAVPLQHGQFSQKYLQKTSHSSPLGRGMGCLLWVQLLIDILSQSLQWCLQYHVILDCVIMAWLYFCAGFGIYMHFIQNIIDKVIYRTCLLWIQPLIDILPQFLQWCL